MTDPDRAAELGALVRELQPVLAAIAELAPERRTSPEASAALVAALEARFPADGAAMRSLGEHLRRGVAEGWLCDRGEPHARFSRLAKPSPQSFEFSIDLVRLDGAGAAHLHPRGEVTLGFVADPDTSHGTERFEDQPPGWVMCRPGSQHVPTTTGGPMLLLYVLPGGAVSWSPAA